MAWSDRYLAIRDRWLSSPKFQRWAAAFPLTRPTARRRAQALFDVCAGFVYSQILYACVRLKLFEALAEAPQSLQALAERLGLSNSAMERLLDAAVSLDLVETRSGARFGLGALGAALVGNPGVASMIEHHRLLYDDLRDPVGLLRGENADTELARYWAYAGADRPAALQGERVADYTALMSASQALIADHVLDTYPLDSHACLLDVGGGEGTFLLEAARRYPKLRLMLFDLPPVAQCAEQKFAQQGLGPRALCVSGDFFADSLPRGADVISFVRVLHDHGDAKVEALLRAAYEALSEGGAVVVAEPMAQTRGAESMGDAYFGFYLLAMGQGRPRSARKITQMLSNAGFDETRELTTAQPLQTGLVVGRKLLRQSVKLS